MRLLVLDDCRMMTWVLWHLCPPGTDIVGVASFEKAYDAVLESPPDAAVVSVPLARLPWRSFRQLCETRTPPVPVLFESAVFSTADEAGLEPGEGYFEFLRKPASREELESALGRLLAAARAAKRPLAS